MFITSEQYTTHLEHIIQLVLSKLLCCFGPGVYRSDKSARRRSSLGVDERLPRATNVARVPNTVLANWNQEEYN